MEFVIILTAILFVLGIGFFAHHRGDRARVRSHFSEMLIRDEGRHRMLFFLQKNGQRALESSMDRENPDLLVLSYSRMMMACHIIAPDIQRCLILGLGGGSMVKFLNRFFPGIQVDVVEIDPQVEAVAREYFALPSHPNTRIFLEDAHAFLERSGDVYDVIHVDAFLKVADDTDTMGIPLRLKTDVFYGRLQKHLSADGLAVFNMNHSRHTEEDVRIISSLFPSAYRFAVPGWKNVVLIASMNPRRLTSSELEKKATHLDAMGIPGLSFREMVGRLVE